MTSQLFIYKTCQWLLPAKVFCVLLACFNSLCVCCTFLFHLGFFRSAKTIGSVDRNGNPQPWFTYPAIEYLRRKDLSEMNVFEFGSGYSTAFFSSRARGVTSAESQSEWRDKTEVMCAKRGNTDIIFAGNEREYLDIINRRSFYDLIVIDGLDWRLACAKVSIKKLRPGGMIVVDNTNDDIGRSAAEYLESLGLLRVDFWGFYPAIRTYGSTTIFFNVTGQK